MANQNYTLPELSFGYGDLAPYISEEQLKIHHQIHHQGYVNNSNDILEKLQQTRREEGDVDQKATLKALSFNLGGHILHSLFWKNLAPEGQGGEPEDKLKEMLEEQFGSIEGFKKEFSAAAAGTEGSGWGALVFCHESKKLLLMQIEKHNNHIYPGCSLLMVLDVWEHAYYLDYQNKRKDFVDAFWKIVNWQEVGERLDNLLA